MKKQAKPLNRFYAWLDERTGIDAAICQALAEPIRGGSRWAYVFGSGLAFLIALQVVTGILLTLYYVPSADHAHASVAYIQKAVPGGALLRGLHYYAASGLVLLVAVHLAQVVLFGAYKGKRELVWLSGGVMLFLILAFAFTGTLLPWDQAAYFGTKVGTAIAGEIPVVGPLQQRIMQGGAELGTLTLSRFYTVHTYVLPLLVGLLLAAHIYLFRKAGPAGPFHRRADQRVERFYPKQLFKDSVFMLLLFLGLVGLALLRPAELGPEADPTADFLARPPWFFLPLFQLLKYFPGQLALIPTVLLPGALAALIFILPFFDQRPERHPLKRPLATAVLTILLLGAGGLVALSKYEDRRNPEFAAKLRQQEAAARKFLQTKFEPQPIGRGALNLPALPKAPAAFAAHCAACHGERGEGGVGPTLTGLVGKPQRSAEDLLKLLDDTRAFGLEDPMPASFPKLSATEKQQIVEWLKQLK